jgi:hypothetical protein
MTQRRVIVVVLLTVSMQAGAAPMPWDGSTTLYNIDFKPENFLDINSYQFRPSEEIRWFDVENGWRVTGGSLETNNAYLLTDLRLKRVITPNLNARLRWAYEEFYAPRETDRPLLELELQPSNWPVSVSLLGAPAYAKGEAELGLAASLGLRPWNYVRIAWLRPDYYYNNKNDFDNSYYRREPSQLTVDTAYKWGERYKLRLLWEDNKPLEFVLDNLVSVFSYQNQNYQGTFDYQRDASHTLGVAVSGFNTRQSRDDAGTVRSQNILYYSVNAYWIRAMDRNREWTIGLRYDDFRNRERTPSVPATEFDYLFKTAQAYTSYYLPFAPHQAWELGVYLGQVSEQRDYLDTTIASPRDNYFEAKLRTGWEVFSLDRSSALTLALSWNLDDLIHDTFDGGSVRFRSEF